jgi:hypothetical protein
VPRWRDLFAPKAPITEHPLFGPIAFTTGRGWERKDFEFWGFRDLHLMIDAGADGPTSEQENAFQRLRERRVELLPKCLDAVALRRAETERPSGAAVVSAISIPAMDTRGPGKTGQRWTIWFDYEDEEHWSYGVQSDDNWRTLWGFAED